MKVCTKIFGESGGDNRDIANKMNEQIEEWKEDCLEDEDKIINVESINIIPNDKGIFATVRYTYSVIVNYPPTPKAMNGFSLPFYKIKLIFI